MVVAWGLRIISITEDQSRTVFVDCSGRHLSDGLAGNIWLLVPLPLRVLQHHIAIHKPGLSLPRGDFHNGGLCEHLPQPGQERKDQVPGHHHSGAHPTKIAYSIALVDMDPLLLLQNPELCSMDVARDQAREADIDF